MGRHFCTMCWRRRDNFRRTAKCTLEIDICEMAGLPEDLQLCSASLRNKVPLPSCQSLLEILHIGTFSTVFHKTEFSRSVCFIIACRMTGKEESYRVKGEPNSLLCGMVKFKYNLNFNFNVQILPLKRKSSN